MWPDSSDLPEPADFASADPPTIYQDTVDVEHADLRLDVFLAGRIEDASRTFIKKLIQDGRVTINGRVCIRPARKVALGEEVWAEFPPPPALTLVPENIPIEIVHQDTEVVVVNKPPGLVVHPAPGHYSGTLVHAILHHCPDFERPGDSDRPGIVHRIDRFTSGLLVVAKSLRAFTALSRQAREHAFDRRYLALVRGEFQEDAGVIRAPVGRGLADPTRMTVTGVKGRESVTRFQVLERFGNASLLGITLETGRTHQIRVHLRFAGHPVLGDPVYGVTDFKHCGLPSSVRAALEALPGQALHAEWLGFDHPATGRRMRFTAPPPAEFRAALDALRRAYTPPAAESAPEHS